MRSGHRLEPLLSGENAAEPRRQHGTARQNRLENSLMVDRAGNDPVRIGRFRRKARFDLRWAHGAHDDGEAFNLQYTYGPDLIVTGMGEPTHQIVDCKSVEINSGLTHSAECNPPERAGQPAENALAGGKVLQGIVDHSMGTRDPPIQKARWGADWTSWRAEFRWSRVMLTRGTVF